MKIWQWLLILGVSLYLLSGFYIIDGDEQGVIQIFGRVWPNRITSGLHYGPPWPITELHKLKVRKVQRISLGMGVFEAEIRRQASPEQAEFLTGDQNIINVRAVVQYTIREPIKFLFISHNPERLIGCLAESALAWSVAQIPVDLALTTEKIALQQRVRQRTQQLIDEMYDVGLSIVGINLERIEPSEKVKEAFEAVNGARQGRHRLVLDAQSYVNTILPKARGEAQKALNDALAYKDRRLAEAKGETARFIALFEAYRKAKDATSARLYIETMEEVLPKLRKVVVDEQSGKIDLGIIK